MSIPYDYFTKASNQILIDRHKRQLQIKPRCKSCNRILDEEDINKGKDLAFGLCNPCRIIASEWHECGNCQGTAAPGHELCYSCFEILKG